MDANNFENIDEVLSVALKRAADTCNRYMLMSMESRRMKARRERSLSHASSMRMAAMIFTNNSEIISKIDKDIQYYKDEIEGCEKVVTAIQNITDEATKSFNNDKESLKQFFDEMKRNSEEETGGVS